MRDLVEAFLQYNSVNLAATSVQTFREAFAPLCRYFSEQPVESITTDNILKWMAHVKQEGRLREATIMDKLALMNRLFKFALARGRVSSNPINFELLPRLKTNRKQKQWFSVEDHRKLLASASQSEWWRPYWESACIVGFSTGLRMSDVAVLKWTNVDFERADITVIPMKTRRLGITIIIPFQSGLLGHLLKLRNENASREYVIPHFHLEYMRSRRDLSKRFVSFCDRAGLKGYSFHSYRHGFVTRMLNAGVEAIVIQGMTGQSLDTISKYAHISNDRKLKALSMANEEPETAPSQLKVVQL